MYRQFFKHAILLLLVFFSFIPAMKCYAYGIESYNTKSFESRFLKISDDKYYTHPGSIYIASDSIYFCFDGQFLPVSNVECDDEGVFIRAGGFMVRGQCPICQYPITPWGLCSNPDCPTKE
ncbi:MAG: hypothetical protein SP1CHLAM42_15310 [Chlamydiales bacterium]|nr:hypothetical protein [Chlamydiales bacterium]